LEPKLETRAATRGLGIAIGVAIIVRLAVMMALPQPVVSDGLAYFDMADGAAHGRAMVDNFGQYAFYSPGYPLLLVPLFAMLDSHLWVALGVNLACAVASIMLVHALARRITDEPLAPVLAAFGLALWLPAILATGVLAKENLSVPLLLAFALLCIDLPRSRRPWLLSLGLGLMYGASLLVGGSIILTVAGYAVALLLWNAPMQNKAGAAVLFAAGTIAVLAPWLWHVRASIGVAMLSSNAPFNLYLGNNPSATGWFVSIMDTPLGAVWHRRSAALGEAGTAAWLNCEALSYIAAHPMDSVLLGLRKLMYFWYPHGPHVAGDHPTRAVVIERLVVDAQYLVVLALGGIGLIWARLTRGTKRILIAIIIAFWLIHGVTYIIPRYHEPVMPFVLLLGAIWLSERFGKGLRVMAGA
jgi:hypothetical protein